MVDGSNVAFRGAFESHQMQEIMSEIDVLVIPSRWYENSPLVLLYALATHTPVIISDVAGMTEFLEEGKNGFSFQRSNVDHLEAVLRSLVLDQDRLYDLSATTHFERTTKMMAEETLLMYA
jgi:glycosyltransferase involved in cell wall biosynthesis